MSADKFYPIIVTIALGLALLSTALGRVDLATLFVGYACFFEISGVNRGR